MSMEVHCKTVLEKFYEDRSINGESMVLSRSLQSMVNLQNFKSPEQFYGGFTTLVAEKKTYDDENDDI